MLRGGPTVGVLTPLAGGHYYGALLSGIARVVSAHGGRVIAVQTIEAGRMNPDFSREVPFDSTVAWDRFDAFITIINAVPSAYAAAVEASARPLVSISYVYPEGSGATVLPDNRSGVREAVRHLVEHGHRKIAFVGSLSLVNLDIRERFAAYESALRELGIVPDPALVYDAADYHEFGGEGAAQRMLEDGLPSTAVVCATDANAFGVMRVLSRSGRCLPGEQAVIGFDDLEAASHSIPSLSTVRQDFTAVGAAAASLVLQRLGRDAGSWQSERVVVPSDFVARESCGCSGWPSSPPQPDDGIDGGAWLEASLHRVLTPEPASVDPARRTAVADVVRWLEHASLGEQPPRHLLRAALGRALSGIEIPHAAPGVVHVLRQLLRRPSDADPGPASHTHGADAVVSALWAVSQTVATDALAREGGLRATMASQYMVGVELLDDSDHSARGLTWLRHTSARAGVLGLWSRESTLEVAGSFSVGCDELPTHDSPIPLAGFPPREFTEQPVLAGEVIVVVPVKTATSDWGWLATAGPVDVATYTGRETMNQWAAMLTVALDNQEASSRLAALEQERRAILDATPDAIARYDSALRYEYLNAEAAARLGLHPSAVIGRRDAELGGDAAFLATWEGALREALRSGAPARLDYTLSPPDGDPSHYQAHVVPQTSTDGTVVGVLVASRDITALRAAELALTHRAFHDPLTGLANRHLLIDRLSLSIARLERDLSPLVVLFIDLDHFKEANDTLGHDVGDRVLVEVARRLRASSRSRDTVARLGGDEFVVICENVATLVDVNTIAQRTVAELARPYEVGPHGPRISASIGVVTVARAGTDPHEALRDADAAMYTAKQAGGNRFAVAVPGAPSMALT